MEIFELIKNLPVELAGGDPYGDISDITSDSRKAGPGVLFTAFAPLNCDAADGHDFVCDAYERGCTHFLVERIPEGFEDKADVTVLLAQDTRKAVALLSRRFFDFPEDRLKLIGLVGTKGKTTISFMLKSIFEKAGKKIGLIGSNGVIYGDRSYHLPNTTPESYVIHSILKDMADAGVEYCVLEATSQGFMLHRTYGIVFDVSIFTNISPDHISKTEHESFEDYFECKRRVFSQTRLCYVNRDSDRYSEIVAGVPEDKIKTYGKHKRDGSFCVPEGTQKEPSLLCFTARDIRLTQSGGRPSEVFLCEAPGWTHEMRVNIPGLHNVENALGAICLADHYGIDPEHIESGLLESVSPEGRMELVDVPAPITVFIDYAHNKLSMETMMATAKLFEPNRILCVFGLDGDRAHVRRKDCGEILGRDADYTILSDTSPRTDDPDRILAEVASHIERAGGAGKYEIVRDRHVSIPKILDMAEEGDLVLIVGTGDRQEMVVQGKIIPINEREIIMDHFAGKEKGAQHG